MKNNIDVIIETPKEGHFKYKYDQSTGMFKLNKILPQGLIFPYDFGFIPYTIGEDGEPLDVLVLSEHAFFPGCIVECRIIGAIKSQETEDNIILNCDNYIGVPILSDLYKEIHSIEQIAEEKIREIENFFIHYYSFYNKLFLPVKTLHADEASRLIKQGNSEFHHIKHKTS